ncbi:MAG: glycosyltransferase [Candidatus Omnitrophica bacterium]|nr:glycosyltransferase [Candidatus Omnitrophota bacterium]
MKKQFPKVSIIIVNRNGKHFIKDCFDSLLMLQYPGEKPEVIMVDNDSHDGSLHFVKRNYPRVKTIACKDNNYCRSLNLAIQASSADFVVTLNNDTRVDAHWLTELMVVALKDKKIAGVGSKILFFDGKINSVAHKALPNYYWSDFGFQDADRGQFNTMAEVESICGASSLYRKACLEEVGLFDEDFEMYIEDVDLNMRLRNKGYKIYYAPKSIVHHKYHGTAGDDFTVFHVERNRLLFIAKHFPDRLGEALMGSGYFTVPESLDRERDIYNVLPQVLAKLYRHHQTEFTRYFPDLCAGLKRIANLEKDRLIQFVEKERERYAHSQADIATLQKLSKEQETLLREKGLELNQIQNELNAKTALLSEKDLFLEKKDTEFRKIHEELRARLAELQEKDALLIKQEVQVSQKDGQLTQFAAQLKQQFETLQNKDALIAQKDILVAEKDKQLVQTLEQLKERNEALKDKDIALAQRDALLQERKMQLEQLGEHLRVKLSELQQKDELIAQKDILVAEKEHQLKQLQEEIALLTSELRDRDVSLQEKDLQLTKLVEQLQKKVAIIERLGKNLKTKSELATQLETLLQKNKEELLSLVDELEEKKRQVQEKDELILAEQSQRVQFFEQLQEQSKQLKDAQWQLQQKDVALRTKIKEIEALQDKFNAFYSSQTFVFVVRPLWRFLDFIKCVHRRVRTFFSLKKYSTDKTTSSKLDKEKWRKAKKTVYLSSFLTNVNKAFYRGNNRYSLKITNISKYLERAKVTIDILSHSGPKQNLYASFGKIVELKPKFSTEVEFEYNWADRAFFYNNGYTFSPDNLTFNFDEPQEGYFTLRASVCDNSGSPKDTLEIHQLLVK